jgi:hypothetical protein
VLQRTDDAHRRVVYGSRRSRLHLNLFIKDGERVSLWGAFRAPHIYYPRRNVLRCLGIAQASCVGSRTTTEGGWSAPPSQQRPDAVQLAVRDPQALPEQHAACPAARLHAELLHPRREPLRPVLNNCQENLHRGGLSRRSPSGWLTRTRRVTSIRRDVTLNSQLWDLAAEVLAA